MGCNTPRIEISGTAKDLNGSIINVIDLSDKTVLNGIIASGKFELKENKFQNSGYYTFSITSGQFPRDYEVYLEPGKYIVNIPENENDYLQIITDSKIQNNLSAYYNFENKVMAKFRQEKNTWTAKLNAPETKLLPDAEIDKIIEKVEFARKREHGLHIAAIDMFIAQYPQNDIVPHIISNLDYQADPQTYYLLFNKLSPQAKNSQEGKHIGGILQQLITQHQRD